MLTQKFEQGSVKLALISRELNQADGDKTSAWGATLSGNAKLWEGGLI